jgi:hypothetical protein
MRGRHSAQLDHAASAGSGIWLNPPYFLTITVLALEHQSIVSEYLSINLTHFPLSQ